MFKRYNLLLTSSARQWLEQLLEAYGAEDPEAILTHLAAHSTEGECAQLQKTGRVANEVGA